MKKFSVNQADGILTVGNVNLGPLTKFAEFSEIFSTQIRLIFGQGGTGQYVLTDLVKFMGEDFRSYFRFKNDCLQSCVIKLVSGIAKERTEDYPEYSMLQQEVDYIFQIYKSRFSGKYSSEYEWKKVWSYDWGEIILSQEAHSAQVITDVIWS